VPTFIETQFPIARLSAESYKERKANNGQTLTDRRNLLDAVPQRFTRALEEASQLLEPKAVRVVLPSATIKNAAELDQWLADVREQVEEQLNQGPVIL